MESFTNVAANLQRFCAVNSSLDAKFKKYKKKNLNQTDVQNIYCELSEYLLNLEFTEHVVHYFRKEFLYILTLAFEGEKNYSHDEHIRNTIVFARLLDLHPDSHSFILKYFEKYPSPFNATEIGPKMSKVRKHESIKFNDFDILDAYYRLLKFKPELFKTLWSWSHFFEQFNIQKDPMLTWLYCHCVAIYTGMNEKQLNLYLKSLLSEEIIIDCGLKYLSHSKPLNLMNDASDFEEQNAICSKNVIYVNGIYLPIYKCADVDVPKIIEVESTKRNLHKIALGIATNRAINLLGPVGSGKTSMIEYLAAKTGRILGDSFIKIQLGDQTDSKMLLGTYRCTDIPGEFVWQPGVLTQAVLDGAWLLLEDIDSSSMDIACVLSGLIENGYLTVPGYRDHVAISPGFQLFLTQRLVSTVTGHHKKHSNANTLLEKQVLSINMEPINPQELNEIVTTLYPMFQTISSRMVDVFLLFSKNLENIPRTNRLISTRDFFKWCSRAAVDFDVSSQASALKVLQDAIDIFCCSHASSADALKIAKEISSLLGIINEKARYFCQEYKPHLSLTHTELKAGRASISRFDASSNKAIRYCFTRPSACLLERVMCCIKANEPVLLVGETGTGKTSSVQYLAHTIGQKLIVINMNQQSDSADLLGGYKPVDLKFVIAPIKAEFEEIFKSYFNPVSNKQFLSNLNYCFNERRWNYLIKLMNKSYEAAMNRLKGLPQKAGQKRGSQKEEIKDIEFYNKWHEIGIKLEKLDQLLKNKNALAFSFIEGSLVKAIENGYWVLLDEINLANAETLECLSGLLEGSDGTLSLFERGDKKPIKRHPNFILFACMNPSTDVGKKELPIGLRNRFTEFYVEELTGKLDLILLVNHYLEAMMLTPERLEKIVKLYLKVRKEATISLSDGLGHKPHFSLRSLCRALYIASKNPCGTFNRSLYEAFCLSFLTQLDALSYKAVENMIASYLIGGQKELNAVLKQPIPDPKPGSYLQFEGYWVLKGDSESIISDDYILTESVRRNLKDLVRVVSIGKLPVLLQGDTSVGKTSLITYLARASGYKCTRINNHEHTDLQEYIGSYSANEEGKLEFREGLLVQAMRRGHWIILDELNLAPTDVLEALNRVLDDNRELFIPETQETVKAHPNFMLFATQNPPGAYGGRKMLSRAFRNRFVELHFNEIPHDELEFIIHKRCHMAPSYAKKMIHVMRDLQTRRRGSAAFAGKHGFITLRDLFRWGERYRLAENPDILYDWDQHLADEGYLLLAGRVRKNEERQEIAEVLNKYMKRKVLPENLFTLSDKTSPITKMILERIMQNKSEHKIVWTYNMRQLAVLILKALEFNEPVLLVGETGGGKTTVCSLIAENANQQLVTVNCHMHTESSDFLGGLRPVRDRTEENLNKLFEWVDGPLVQALLEGDLFLADEISLADDSVLERLNSLLEPERTLLLTEKGTDSSELIIANKKFHFIGTMNPGGDFGKKELSPALRNRFTEIWCETCSNRQDLIDIIEHNIKENVLINIKQSGGSSIGVNIMDFIEWFKCQEIGKRFTISIRDILTWVNFINACSHNIGTCNAYLHGACLTFLDSFGSGVTSTENASGLEIFRKESICFIEKQIKFESKNSNLNKIMSVENIGSKFGIKPFYIDSGNAKEEKSTFSFNAPTTAYNALRLLRGLQLSKALLLEGSPGVGKTSLVTALAQATRNQIFRINLSDQTDISDLFGADLPVEGGQAGQFSWKDGPLLQALKQGHWILLDELNLASQSVLEGLNACLDHRGEIFIPELGKTFNIKPGTKFFGCQNPLKQGGSRRGLPQSFLNRFTQVYLTGLNDKDLHHILTNQFPTLPKTILENMISFNKALNENLDLHIFGFKGSPWEFNLRDLTRWCEATVYHQQNNGGSYCPENLVNLLFIDRMRTLDDKNKIIEIFENIFGRKLGCESPICFINMDAVMIGDVKLDRNLKICNTSVLNQEENSLVLRSQLKILRSLIYCINLNWMSILVGSASSGKSSVVHTLARLSGQQLRTLPVTSAMDTTDILGGFEQADYTRHLEELSKNTEPIVLETIQKLFMNGSIETALGYLRKWEKFMDVQRSEITLHTTSMSQEKDIFMNKLERLFEIWDHFLRNENSINTTNKIQTLMAKGRTIKENIEDDDSLKAGGKFEWVDSVLVKCLQDGSWLLIDNVNLCSPAVLDRLNALLEPNGVLTIGERGVDKNGRMITIKPHPQFRLFLTMDPKNGEISRAMRNRGVEMYILNIEESTNSVNLIDIKSMIYQQQLTNKQHINALIDIHYFISDITLGSKPSTGQLLQAAYLIAQLISRGVNATKAFTNTILDVYCGTKSESEFDTINAKSNIIDLVQSKLTDNNIADMYDARSTLSTKKIETNSKLMHVEQQVVLFEKYLNQPNDDTKIINLPQFLLIHFFTITTKEDLSIRTKYMQQMLSNENYQKLVQHIFTELSKIQFNSPNLPLDYRWLPDVFYRTIDETQCNKIFLLLYYVTYIIMNEGAGENKMKNKSFTILEYLMGVKKREIEAKIDDPVLNHILNLLAKYDLFIYKLSNMDLKLDNEVSIEVLSLIQYRFLLYKYLNLKLTKLQEMRENESILNNLHVYYKWFVKFSVKKLQVLLKIDTFDLELTSIIDTINKELVNHFSVLRKIGKHYQKALESPPPLINNLQLKIVPEFHQILDKIDIYSKCTDFATSVSFILNKPELKMMAVTLKQDFGYEFEHSPENYDQFKDDLSHYNFGDIKSTDVKLLPVFDYILNLQILKMKCSVNDDNSQLENYTSVPIKLIATLRKYKRDRDNRLLHELSTEIHRYLKTSACIKPDCFINYGKDGDKDRLLSLHNPILSYLFMELLVDIEGQHLISVSRLGNFRDILMLYKRMHGLLWKNIRQLSDFDFSFIYCEMTYLKSAYKEFCVKLSSTLNIENNNSFVENAITAISNLYKSSNHKDKTDEQKTFIHLLRILSNEDEILNNLNIEDEETTSLNSISNLYIILNFCKALLNSKLPFIDPLSKITMKQNDCAKEMGQFKDLIESYTLQNEIYSNDEQSVSPICDIIKVKLGKLNTNMQDLGKYVAVRPIDLDYHAIRKHLSHGFATVLSTPKVLQTYNDMNHAVHLVQKGLFKKVPIDLKTAETTLQYAISTTNSYESFINGLQTYRPTYPDIVEPILSNIVEMQYGIDLKISLLKKLIMKYKHLQMNIDLKTELIDLVKFPVLDKKRSDYKLVIDNYISERLSHYIYNTLKSDVDITLGKRENFNLLKCGIIELSTLCNVDCFYTNKLENELFEQMNKLIRIFVNAWKKQEEEMAAKKKEDESLYKTKTKCDDKTEEEISDEEFTRLFISYHDKDFDDLVEKDLGDDPSEDETNEFSEVIKLDDILFVSNLHSNFMVLHTQTEWLASKATKQTYQHDHLTPLLHKIKIFKLLMNKTMDCLSYKMDAEIIGSLNILVGVAKCFGDIKCLDKNISSDSNKYNFYNDSNVDEVKSCFHILEELRLKINELLNEWPEHPTLRTINTIIERIYNFEITSPLPRFLTGLDILLTKCHEWEQNAHSGVSLSHYSLNIGQQMITWRKLEMNNWKFALDNSINKLTSSVAKYWFYIYDIMREYIDEKLFDTAELISSLQKFIIQSSVVEFEKRINLLNVFHCHATYLPKSAERDNFISILWNLYKYYEQFIPNVISRIKTQRTPIEKKLKDYIKIVRWKDISYWALKDTLQKTQKVIFKHMKEFEDILKQPVSSLLVNSSSQQELVGVHDRPQRTSPKSYHYTLDSSMYLSKLQLKTLTLQLNESSILHKSERYLKKSKTLCQNLIQAAKYPKLIKELDCFVAQVISTSEHLQGLEITASLPKEKKISQAKGHLQQKQRALSDLFKSLSKIGLSFRKGIVENKQKDITAEFIIKPIDFSAALSHIPHSRNDEKLLIMWDSVEIYYRKALMRKEILDEALKTPPKDLGFQNVERCKGFSGHLMLVCQKQKIQLVETSKLLYSLRYYQSILNETCEPTNFVHIDKVKHLTSVLKNTVLTMEQYKMILLACPENDLLESGIDESPVLTPIRNFIQTKGDQVWSTVLSLVENIKTISERILAILKKVKSAVPFSGKLQGMQYVHLNNIKLIEDELKAISDNFADMVAIFGEMPFGTSAKWLSQEIQCIDLSNTNEGLDDNIAETEASLEGFKTDTENLLSTILLIIQNIHKKYDVALKDATEEGTEVEENEETLLNDHLAKLIVDNINEDIEQLDMAALLRVVKRVVKQLSKLNPETCCNHKQLTQNILPFLDQVILLCQYFITQQVSAYRITCKTTSVLLNIFIDLATKGFCIPPELSENMGEEGQQSSNGMGLGDGEGEKDVSDRIESEDQLDDAQPAGQEKQKEDDKDCKEEEKGIEMSEDFDSKLQDVEKKPEDESDNESDDDSNADEQMGDTEPGADQLDKEVWGSDNEDDTPENEEGKNEEKGDKGEKEGEQELTAKDNAANAPEDEDEKQDPSEEKDKKKKDDINEMDEPEFDDNQTDPYHGNQPELPEPEPLDLPDDLQLDSDGEKEEQGEDNPFDIDAMKDQMPVPEPPENEEEKEKNANEDKNEEDMDASSDEEESNIEKKDSDEMEVDENEEESKKDDGVKAGQEEEENNEAKPNTEDNTQSGIDEKQTNEDNIEAADQQEAVSADKVQAEPSKEQKTDKPTEDVYQEETPDKEGTGQSQMEDSKTGHKGQANAQQASDKDKAEEKDLNKRTKPGDADIDRSLGDSSEPVKKKMKTMNADDSKEELETEEQEKAEETVADMYQHIKEAKESSTQVMDAITKEQFENLEEKQIPNKDDEEVDEPNESQTDLQEESVPEEDVEMSDVQKQKAEKIEHESKKASEKMKQADSDLMEDMKDIEVEGDVIETQTVSRGGETTHHTLYNTTSENIYSRLSAEDMDKLRIEVENQLSVWNQVPSTTEAEKAWEKISSITSALAQNLSEQLRLVLEPTQASSLKGDFRTGRRINMRKVIPYIASQFRKDKIWLRRTKPSKREYQIVLAIDDSSSMADNHSKELAFESVALISKALTLLESGQLSILSFGENTEVLHKLTDTFTEKTGSKLLQKFQFDQKKTCVAKLVDFATEMLNNSQHNASSLLAKLLIVVSDGRGIFSEGETYVQQAVRRAKLSNIFMIFVIIDNPNSNNSILDIRKPVFKDGKIMEIKSYMDAFPFQFYLILRDINTLPSVLSDALRQWFEIVSNVDKQ